MPPTPRPQGSTKNVKVPTPGGEGANRRLLVLIGAAGLVVVVAAVLVYLLLGGSSSAASDAPKLLEAAGCTVKTVKALPGEHTIATREGTSKKWNTSPPTSGPHYEVAVIWGAYTEPVFPAQLVHNLEHGGIFIQYGKDVSEATIAQLKGFYDSHQDGTVLAPLPSLGSKIAIGAWTTRSASSTADATAHLATCPSFDEKAYAAFFDTYQFKGPERFPAHSLMPGS